MPEVEPKVEEKVETQAPDVSKPEETPKPPKKKSKLPLFLGVFGILILICLGMVAWQMRPHRITYDSNSEMAKYLDGDENSIKPTEVIKEVNTEESKILIPLKNELKDVVKGRPSISIVDGDDIVTPKEEPRINLTGSALLFKFITNEEGISDEVAAAIFDESIKYFTNIGFKKYLNATILSDSSEKKANFLKEDMYCSVSVTPKSIYGVRIFCGKDVIPKKIRTTLPLKSINGIAITSYYLSKDQVTLIFSTYLKKGEFGPIMEYWKYDISSKNQTNLSQLIEKDNVYKNIYKDELKSNNLYLFFYDTWNGNNPVFYAGNNYETKEGKWEYLKNDTFKYISE